MIKEILIFMLFLQISNGENLTNPNCDQYTKSPPAPGSELPSSLILPNTYDACKDCDGYILGRLETICIPSFYKNWLHLPPLTTMEEPPLTKIQIKMSNIEVIEINTDTLKLNLDFEVTWNEYRLTIWINEPQEYTERVVLSMEDREIIWSPLFVFGPHMVSEKKIDEKQGVMREYKKDRLWGFNTFQLSATIKCKMDFQRFPFDEHSCNLEVSSILFLLHTKNV